VINWLRLRSAMRWPVMYQCQCEWLCGSPTDAKRDLISRRQQPADSQWKC
jgi:hypothetical protein